MGKDFGYQQESESPTKKRKIQANTDEMAAPEHGEGFMIHDTKNWTKFSKEKFTPKTFEDYDVDIENECCGVCGSDVHTTTGGWGELATAPICVGHEIIGKVLRVGSQVKEFKAGDRVGVGAQVQSCMKCPQCKSNNENYCPNMVDTYGAPYNVGGGNPSKDAGGPMKDKNGKQIFARGWSYDVRWSYSLLSLEARQHWSWKEGCHPWYRRTRSLRCYLGSCNGRRSLGSLTQPLQGSRSKETRSSPLRLDKGQGLVQAP